MRDRDRLSLKNQTLIVGVGASAGGRMKLKGGHVYLCPPQRLLEMKSGFVQVVENDDEARLRHVIDHFLHSLALDQSDRVNR